MVEITSSNGSEAPPSKQKTTLGTVVHVLGLFLSVFGAGIVYIIAKNEVTKTNAKNALNWQITFLLTVILIFALGVGLQTVSELFGIVAALLILLLAIVDISFCLLATIKSNGGNKWTYPFTPNFL